MAQLHYEMNDGRVIWVDDATTGHVVTKDSDEERTAHLEGGRAYGMVTICQRLPGGSLETLSQDILDDAAFEARAEAVRAAWQAEEDVRVKAAKDEADRLKAIEDEAEAKRLAEMKAKLDAERVEQEKARVEQEKARAAAQAEEDKRIQAAREAEAARQKVAAAQAAIALQATIDDAVKKAVAEALAAQKGTST